MNFLQRLKILCGTWIVYKKECFIINWQYPERYNEDRCRKIYEAETKYYQTLTVLKIASLFNTSMLQGYRLLLDKEFKLNTEEGWVDVPGNKPLILPYEDIAKNKMVLLKTEDGLFKSVWK